MNALSTPEFKTLTKVLFFKCSRTFGCKANPPQPPFKKGGDNAGVGGCVAIRHKSMKIYHQIDYPKAPLFEGGLGGFALNYKRLGNKKMLTYSKIVKPLARELRNNQTDAEVLLWSRIRRKQILGVQFNRQKPIDRYIVDFYSASTKLVIELDGIQHYEIDAIEYDFERTKMLESFGLKVMRFDNSLIFSELDNVISIIYDEVKNRISC